MNNSVVVNEWWYIGVLTSVGEPFQDREFLFRGYFRIGQCAFKFIKVLLLGFTGTVFKIFLGGLVFFEEHFSFGFVKCWPVISLYLVNCFGVDFEGSVLFGQFLTCVFVKPWLVFFIDFY